ncbi:hypothetical protein DFQ30_005201 [Apophysomyces sp. BC1015]|nr:hypothetical protein DFQ30_005201 [Apophysomyces sp. BC1015]
MAAEVHLREPEAERTNRRDLVEIGELRLIVDVAARHASRPEEMHRKERDVEEEAAYREHEDEADCEQHRRLERERATPHRRNPIEHLDASGYRDQHRRVHKEQLTGDRHAGHEHVVRPYHERKNCDREQ